MSDGVDERIVDGRRLRYDGRNSLGVRVENVTISEGVKIRLDFSSTSASFEQ